MRDEAQAIVVVNPLPSTLSRYQTELVETIGRAQTERRIELYLEPGDGNQSVAHKILSAMRILAGRSVMGRRYRAATILVTWPLFGYFDVLSWILAARRNTVICLVHDPLPLRRQIGHSWLAKKLFHSIVARFNIVPVCHTELAGHALREQTGVDSIVASHPIASARSVTSSANRSELAAIRVMGQFKAARTLNPLNQIADSSSMRLFKLEIHGSKWPAVPGWEVSGVFVLEDEFDRLVRTANCVVIPYSHFFQSGVAVRCLEAGVPIVAPRHEHIEGLYGIDWPGIVDTEGDWPAAVLRVQHTTSGELERLAERARNTSDAGWSKLMDVAVGGDRIR